MKTSEVLNRAADLIEERGWAAGKGWMGVAEAGPLCVEGGIQAAMGVSEGPGYRCAAYRAVCAYLERPEYGLWSWNDNLWHDQWSAEVGVDRAKDLAAQQVIEVLRAAAVVEAAREEQDAAWETYAEQVTA